MAPEPAKLDSEPPLSVMSASRKSVVDSLEVNVSAMVASLVVVPELTVDEEMVMVGSTPSMM